MSRALILSLLFIGAVMNPCWAQNKSSPEASSQPYPGGSEITFQYDYSCPGVGDCSFNCGTGGAGHVTKLGISFGAMPIGTDQKNPTLFYNFVTREGRQGSGFSVSAGLNTLQCQVNGLTLDYSGPPREVRRTNTPMSQDNTAPTTTGTNSR
jgi:hypothetical protein